MTVLSWLFVGDHVTIINTPHTLQPTAHTYLAAAAAVQCDDSGAGACAEQWPVQCRSTHTADMSFFGDIKDKMEDWAEDKLEEALNSISQDGELDERWQGLVQSIVNTE